MILIYRLFVYNLLLTVTVIANVPLTESAVAMDAGKTINISPEIIKELMDFEQLIPTVIIDEIVAKHYLVDGNFRTALKYLRSNEFTQLQRQLLTMPEIINVLDFLHITNVNATTKNERASLDDYADNGIDKMTSTQEATTKTLSKRPQFRMKFNDNDIDVNSKLARVLTEQLANMYFVLLNDSKVETNAYDIVPAADHSAEPSSPHSLSTFTSFVEEILQHLPNSAYQNMIKEKCQKNAQFAEFYKALRSPEFKPLVEAAVKTPNILKIINNLNSEDIDVISLTPIAFQVISWGPNV